MTMEGFHPPPATATQTIDKLPVTDEAKEGEGNAYAWGKTAMLLIKDSYLQAIKNTTGDIVIVNLCSAFPYLEQIFRENHREECYQQAKHIVGQSIFDFEKQPIDPEILVPIPAVGLLNSEEKQRVRKIIAPRKTKDDEEIRPRKLIEAAIQDLLYDPPSFDETQDDFTLKEKIAYELWSNFRISNKVYRRIFERNHLPGRGRWEILVPQQTEKTLEQEFSLAIGKDKSEALISDLAKYFTNKCLPHLRRFSVISLDMEDPETLFNEAQRSFPKDFTKTELFSRSAQHLRTNHIKANTLYLPFKRHSVTLYVGIEGYPFYFNDVPFKEHIGFINSIIDTLVPGGQAVFAPWHIYGASPADEDNLSEIVRRLWEMDMIVTKKTESIEELKRHMGERETKLTQHSPVFANQEKTSLTTLFIENPK